jgi:hypothetical protein
MVSSTSNLALCCALLVILAMCQPVQAQAQQVDGGNGGGINW